MKFRHLAFRQPAGGEHGFAPAPLRHIKPQRACAVGHVRGLVTCHAQADIVLGQQHTAYLLEYVRLMLAHPGQFRRSEARHCNIAGDGAGARFDPFQLGAFGKASTIVPQDRRAQWPVVRTKQRSPMHLARQPDPKDASAQSRIERQYGSFGRGPPVIRILLRPQWRGA